MEEQPKQGAASDRQAAERPKGTKRVVSFVRSRSNVEKALALLVFILAFLWLVPELQVRYFAQGADPASVPGLINEYRRTWAQIIGGLGLFVGLYFTWRRVEISRRTLETQQQTLETQQDQQITERFTRAIDQLGATTDDKESKPKLEIRLGGIYALERIAKDSPASRVSPGRDYSTVMEVLTAYVRQNAPLLLKEPTEPPVEANETTARSEDAEQQSEGAQQSLASAPQEKPRADIQAALDVLRRRQEDLVSEEYRMELDLRETNLTGASLSKAILTGANLSRAGLYEANLREANLYGANLREANLVESQGLTQEQLEEALGDDNTKLPEGLHPPASWLEA